jgi:dCTP diphosphatase
MTQIKRITQKIKKFRDERDWAQFHSQKNLAISLSLEASEVLEHFQWKNDAESADHAVKEKEALAEELADVAIYLFELVDNANIDLDQAISRKMKKNTSRYPVAKVKWRHEKYGRLNSMEL